MTSGDPAGIGPEVTARALAALDQWRRERVVVFGDPRVLARYGDISGGGNPPLVVAPSPGLAAVRIGRVDREAGRFAYACLESAVDWLRRGRVRALVTAPVSKEAISLAGVPFSGHTGFLAGRFGAPEHGMVFVGGRVRLLLLTTHLPLAAVPAALDEALVYRRIRLALEFFQRHEKGARRLALVCGLNPHAGEHGLLGGEEARVIVPAIRRLRREGWPVEGPVPADAAWLLYRRRQARLLVSAYHDQLLPVFKAFYFQRGVNLTIGLPFIRTSPAHGTAFDLAGRGCAESGGMSRAIELAFRLAGRRRSPGPPSAGTAVG